VLIAESDLNNPRLVHSPARGGYGLDAHWEDDFHHAIHAFFTGERGGYYADFGTLGDLAKTLEQGYVLDGQYSTYRKRTHGRPPLDIAPHQLVVCAQNHDQIGNRALGERLSQLVDASTLKAISALVLLGPFTPMLFQGEEWGARTPFLFFTDHHDELGRAVTEGRQREFAAFAWEGAEVPDPQAPETFLRSKLRWDELDDPACRELLEWHRSLIALRRTIPVGTPTEVRYDEAARWLTLRRGSLLAVFNFAEEPREIPLPEREWKPSLFATGEPFVFPARSTMLLTAQSSAE
jgi:maltooligosyltrehalose trehalohydrolase